MIKTSCPACLRSRRKGSVPNKADRVWLKQKRSELHRLRKAGYRVKSWDATRFLRIIRELSK